MNKGIHTLLIFTILKSLYAYRSYELIELEHNPGLYYEKLNDLRFTKADWKIAAFIDINHLYHNGSLIEGQLEILERVCPHGKIECPANFLRKTYLLNKTSHAEELYAELLDVADEYKTLPKPESHIPSTISKRSVPFGFIGSISRTLFGTLSTEDAEYYNQEIDKLYADQRKMAHLIETQTHVVQSKLSKVESKVIQLQEETEASFLQTQILSNTFKGLADKLDLLNYTILLTSWFNAVEATLDTHIEIYRTTLDIIYDARKGRLHPSLLSKKQLQQLHQNINDINHGYDFPIPKSHIRAEKLSEVAKINLGHYNRRIIVEIHLPLLELQNYELYKMHPLPIPQQLTANKTASAYIIPRTSHIAISEDRTTHTFLEEPYLKTCKHTDYHQICSYQGPIYEEETCELRLLIQPSKDIFRTCDIRYSDIHKTHWTRIPSIDGWLFSIDKETTIQVYCPGEKSEIIPISGIGIIQFRPRCSGRQDRVTLKGIRTLENPINYFYLPKLTLNMSFIAPKLTHAHKQGDLHIIPQTRKINPAIKGWPSIDDAESLYELEKQFEELSTHHRDKKQNKFTIYGSIGLHLILYLILSAIAFIYIFNHWIKPILNKQSKSDQTYKQEERIYDVPEKIYDTPKIRFKFDPETSEKTPFSPKPRPRPIYIEEEDIDDAEPKPSTSSTIKE